MTSIEFPCPQADEIIKTDAEVRHFQHLWACNETNGSRRSVLDSVFCWPRPRQKATSLAPSTSWQEMYHHANCSSAVWSGLRPHSGSTPAANDLKDQLSSPRLSAPVPGIQRRNSGRSDNEITSPPALSVLPSELKPCRRNSLLDLASCQRPGMHRPSPPRKKQPQHSIRGRDLLPAVLPSSFQPSSRCHTFAVRFHSQSRCKQLGAGLNPKHGGGHITDG